MKTLLGSVLAAALVVAGCATTTSGEPHGSPTAIPTPSSSSSPTPTPLPTASAGPTGFPGSSTAPLTPAPSTSGGGGTGLLNPSAATAALMTTTETGTGFTKTQVDTRATPGPCKSAGSPTVEDTVPSDVRVAAAFEAGSKAFVAEVLTVYSDTATAQRALVFGVGGLNCKKGTLHYSDGTSAAATIKAAGRSTKFDGVVVDEVRAWTVTTSTLNIGLIVARIGNAIAAIQLGSLKTSDTSELRNGELIVRDALHKLKAAR